MSSEAVKILIDAEDQASAKIEKASRAVDQSVKKIKDVGGKAKASTEFIGQLAGSLGGGEIASMAGQLGGLTEKISQFSEVSKMGGAGALAFKAGLVGVVGVLSFQVGKSIGDAVFQTEEWTKALEKARQESARLTSELIDQQKYRRDIEKREIALLPAEDQAKAQADMLKRMRSDLERYKTEHEKATKEVEEQAKALTLSNLSGDLLWKGSFNGAVDFAKDNVAAAWSQATGSADAAKNKIEETARFIESLRADIKQMERQTSETESSLKGSEEEKKRSEAAKIFIASLERENQLMTAQGDELFRLKAEMAGLVGEEQARAVELMKQADLERIRKEQAAETSRMVIEAAKQEQAARERSNGFLQTEVQRLKERALAIKEGESAVKLFRLEQQGIGTDLAKQLIEAEKAITAAEEAKGRMGEPGKQMGPTPELQAFQSRLLTRGPSQNNEPMRKVEENTKDMAKLLENVEALMAKVAEATAKTANERGVKLIEVR